MSIFSYEYILEVEVPSEDEEEQYALSDNEPEEEDTPEEETIEEEDVTDDEEDAEESIEESEDDEDYTLDDEEDGDDEDVDDDSDNYSDDESLDGEIRQSEDELMDELSEQEKYVRDKDLKRTYVDLYNSISNILMKVDRVVKTADNIKTLNYCEKRLISTQEMLYDYLLDSYKHKSYIQNLTMYYHVIGILTGINQLFNSLTSSTKV